MKTVICHYHIFKNSGTSFDLLLQKNYNARHITFDGPFPYFSINQDELLRIIMRNRGKIAFSSHQIKLPQPVSLEFRILPVVFVRHPLLRNRSIYKFKKETSDGSLTARAAQERNFGEWLEYSINHNTEISLISNAQTKILGGVYGKKSLQRRFKLKMILDMDQAMRNLENVELLARTEYFHQDVSRFPSICAEYGIDFKYDEIAPQNVTSDDHNLDLDVRLSSIRNEIGDRLYELVMNANTQDLELYNWVGKKIQSN